MPVFAALVLSMLCVAGCATQMRRAEPTTPAPERVHPVLYAYRESLREFLSEEEQAALDAIDWSGTARGDWQRLRYLAADRAVRRILPRLLEAEQNPVLARHAVRLRRLPPLLDRDTDAVAQMAVVEAMVALERVRRGQRPVAPLSLPAEAPDSEANAEGEESEDAPLTSLPHPARELDAEGEGELAEALSEYAVEYARLRGVPPLRAAAAAAAAADAMDVAFLVRRVLESAADRSEVLDEALDLASALAGAARRQEHLPRIRPPARTAPEE